MSAGLLIFVAGIYCTIGFGYLQKGQPGMCAAFFAYAVANLGFAYDAWRP